MMGRMVRKQVYIAPEHEALLKRRAAELGVSEAELIRRGIEAVARRPAPVQRDEQAWQEVMAYIQERARSLPGESQGGLPVTDEFEGPVRPDHERRWPRQEMYDERWERRERRLSG